MKLDSSIFNSVHRQDLQKQRKGNILGAEPVQYLPFCMFLELQLAEKFNTETRALKWRNNSVKLYDSFLVRQVKLWTQRNKPAVAYRQKEAERSLRLVVSKFMLISTRL